MHEVSDGDELARVWCIVAELTTELAETDRRAVDRIIADGLSDGWRPTPTEITDLVAFATQQITTTHTTALRGVAAADRISTAHHQSMCASI